MNRTEQIIDFLKNSHIFEEPAHYNVWQINAFSAGPKWNNPLNVTEKEMLLLERNGKIKHYYTKDHGNCYYVVQEEINE